MNFIKSVVIFFLVGLIFVPSILGQTENFAICYEKQAYLINGETAFSLGKCDKKNWITPLQIEQGEMTKQNKQTSRERQILKLLNNFGAGNLKETNISDSNFINFIKNGKREPTARILLSSFSEEMQKLLTRKEMMEFIITEGALFVARNEYQEVNRFVVKVAGKNPKIGDILEEVKKELRKDTRVKNFNLYLSKYGTWEKLDNEKTIADYSIKNGDKLALFSNVR